MTKNWKILARTTKGEKMPPETFFEFNFSCPLASVLLAVACGLFLYSLATIEVVLQVNKTEQKYIHLMNGEREERGGLKSIERSMKYVRLSVPFLFIDFSGFPPLVFAAAQLLWTLLSCNAVSLFSNSTFSSFFLARSNDFTFLSLFFIIFSLDFFFHHETWAGDSLA